MPRSRTLAFLALVLVAGPAAACAQATLERAAPTEIARAAASITEADYMRRISVIAHDSMRGRDTPSEGLEKTAAWLAEEFRAMGLRGGVDDGDFLQRYPLRAVELDRAGSGLEAAGRRLEYGRDLLPMMGLLPGGQLRGELVLLSGSVGDPPADAVRGKPVVVVLARTAPGPSQADQRRVLALLEAGASAVLVTSGANDAQWEQAARRALGSTLERGWVERRQGGGVFRPLLLVRAPALEQLLAGRGVDLRGLQQRAAEEVRVDATGLAVQLTQSVQDRAVSAPNVVAILEGSDEQLREEYVVFSAHMDHVGIGPPNAEGDSIYNGGDDDASGTIAVVEIAEAMASLPVAPRRSTVFLLVSGEEKGLWGSEYFSENPTVPLEQVVANLNMDMVGRNWTDTIVAIGKEHSDLGATLDRVNAAHPELGMTAIDDIWPEERFYFRSDHYNFARKGVPILFFFNGTHEDYHGPDDEVDRIDGEKAARVARLVFYLGMEIANADEKPEWDPDSYRQIVGAAAR